MSFALSISLSISLSTSAAMRAAAGAAIVTVLAAANAPAAEQQHGRPQSSEPRLDPRLEHSGPPQGAPREEPAFRPRAPSPAFSRPFAPGPRGVQTVNPEFHRGNPLPLNNPQTLRPNVPREEGPGPAAAAPGGGAPGTAPLPAPDGTGSGTVPVQAVTPARPPRVVRPLPPPGTTETRRLVDRGQRFVSLHGVRHALVPIGALGVAVIGDSTWYPDGYVPMEGPACAGPTADGCQLQWRTVDFEDGDGESQPQCVQYCPRPGPPPPEAAALPPPPPLPEGGGECQTTVYSDPNFGGNSAPTGGSQPVLSTTGWHNEIASIVVGAGTWDFFADENFNGEVLRLTPGTYPRLAPEWTRHIGSFMCVKGDVPPA